MTRKKIFPLAFSTALIGILFLHACQQVKSTKEGDAGLIPVALNFNHPGLSTDLGVGLWAWPLPMDWDRDGDMDLLVTCPDVPYKGLYFFENRADGKNAQPVFAAPVRIEDGRKNLQISYVDGEARILERGVEYRHFRDSLFADPQVLFPADSLEKQFTKLRFSQWKYVDFDDDGDLDMLAGIDDWGDYGWDNAFDHTGNWTRGPLHGYVFLLEYEEGNYLNRGKLMAGGEPVDVYGAPTPNMEDFDGDGDLDLICGEFLDRMTWFENIGTRSEPRFAEGRFLESGGEVIRMDLEMIIPAAVDWEGDGDMDLVVGDEDGRVALVENTGKVEDHMPVFLPPAYLKQEAALLKFGALATPFSVDWDSDGDEDLICGNTAGYIGFIENLDGMNPPSWANPVYLEAEGKPIRIMAGENGSIQGPAEKKWGYTTLSVADWDHDGLKDIIVNSIWGRIEWFKNTGTATSPELDAALPVRVDWKGEAPKPAWNWWEPGGSSLVSQWRTSPIALDWNEDGLTDLVMLDHEGYLAYYERFEKQGMYLLRPGERIFHSRSNSVYNSKNNIVDPAGGALRLNEGEAGSSGRRKICLADWDSDGDMDLLVNSVNVAWFENTGTEEGKVFLEYRGDLSSERLAGHTTSPTVVDWNGDGIPELLAGAEDGHFYYFQATPDP
jgi:hypothetical protein